MEQKEAGKTKGAGFVAGVRRTFDNPSEKAWDDLFSAPGLALWLGVITQGAFEKGQDFVTSNGITGKLTVWEPYSHIRMQYKRPEWENASIVQVRVMPADNKTTVSFHQEKISDSTRRQQMKAHWAEVLDTLAAKLWQA